MPPQEEKKHDESEEEHKPDIENVRVSLKSLWKIIVAVVGIISAWLSLQFTVKHVHDEVAALQKDVAVARQRGQEAGAEHNAVHRTLCQALSELGEVTNSSYYVVPENMTLWAISTQVQVAPHILQRYNKIEDPNLIKKGSVIKYPATIGQTTENANPTPNP